MSVVEHTFRLGRSLGFMPEASGFNREGRHDAFTRLLGNVPLSTVAIPPQGTEVHLKGYGFVKVLRTVSPNGDAEYWATNDLKMTEETRARLERDGG